MPQGEPVFFGAKRKTKGNELPSSVCTATYDVDEARNVLYDE